MLINEIKIMYADKNDTGYTVEITLETEDNLEFSGPINIDHDWNYDLGFLSNFVNTPEDKKFVHSVLSSKDFQEDIKAAVEN